MSAPQWEYLVKGCGKFTDLEKYLNELGAEGWELVTTQDGYFYVFKRLK